MAIVMKRPVKTVSVCTDGTLVDAHKAAVAALDAERQRLLGDARLNAAASVKALAKKVVEIEEAAAKDTVHFTITALPRAEWDAFVAANPPRDGNELDEELGFNTDDTFDQALAGGSISEVKDHEGKAVEFDPAKDWAEFSKSLTKGQFEEFRTAVNRLNVGENSVPFCLPAHNLIRATGKS